MRFLIDYSELKNKKEQIVQAIHKMIEETQIDITSLNQLLAQFQAIDFALKITMVYGTPEVQ